MKKLFANFLPLSLSTSLKTLVAVGIFALLFTIEVNAQSSVIPIENILRSSIIESPNEDRTELRAEVLNNYRSNSLIEERDLKTPEPKGFVVYDGNYRIIKQSYTGTFSTSQIKDLTPGMYTIIQHTTRGSESRRIWVNNR